MPPKRLHLHFAFLHLPTIVPTDETDEDVQIHSNDEDEIDMRREFDDMEWKYLAQDSVHWEQLEEAFVRLWAMLISSNLPPKRCNGK